MLTQLALTLQHFHACNIAFEQCAFPGWTYEGQINSTRYAPTGRRMSGGKQPMGSRRLLQ
jgi:hypothetical protein